MPNKNHFSQEVINDIIEISNKLPSTKQSISSKVFKYRFNELKKLATADNWYIADDILKIIVNIITVIFKLDSHNFAEDNSKFKQHCLLTIYALKGNPESVLNNL